MSGVPLLPVELWTLILDNAATDSDVVNVARISRSLRALAQSHHRYTYTLKLVYGQRERKQPLAGVLQHWTNRLAFTPFPLWIDMTLSFSGLDELFSWKLFVAALSVQLVLIRGMILYLTRANHVASVFDAFESVSAPLLQKIVVTSRQRGLRWAPRSLFNRGAPMLRTIHLERVPTLVSSPGPPQNALVNVRMLSLCECDVDIVCLLGVDYPALRDLELKRCTLIASLKTITLLQGAKLHRLIFRDCTLAPQEDANVAHAIYDAFYLHTIPAVRYHGIHFPDPYLWDLLWRGLSNQDVLLSVKLLNRYLAPPRTICVYVQDKNFCQSYWDTGGVQPAMRMLSFKNFNDFTFCLNLAEQLSELRLGDCVLHTFVSTPALWMPQLAQLVISWTTRFVPIRFWEQGHNCDIYLPAKCITPNLRLLTLKSTSSSTLSLISGKELACFVTHMLGFVPGIDGASRPSLCFENTNVDTHEQSNGPHIAFFERITCVNQPLSGGQELDDLGGP